MSNYMGGISRTLLKEFNNISDDDTPKKSKKAESKKENDRSSENRVNTPTLPTRDYETRHRQRSQGASGQKAASMSSKTALKPRQENSLGELTKKFIMLIKQSEDYCIDLNVAVKELNVQK